MEPVPPTRRVGPGLTNLEYAPLAEIMGRSVQLAPGDQLQRPDTGNMEVLTLFGSGSTERWLRPLLDGTIARRS